MLQNEVGGNEAQEELYERRGDYNKSSNRVAGGLKAYAPFSFLAVVSC
jgi:hypothetical protein